MSTSKSPARKLKAEADKIAKIMKAVERGERSAADPAGKIAASLARGSVKFGIVMDDKIITIEMPTATKSDYCSGCRADIEASDARHAKEFELSVLTEPK